MEAYIENHPWLIALIVCLGVFDYIMKIYSMWFAAKRSQKTWFVCLAIFNTIGILPLIYLNVSKGKKASE